uniref:Uncharacterized protein n=1 Tax=Nelumbo nucifera TaxID=4432 RepID=A0A822YEL7_NELNU|nr:TPA_asm: hypothetical protein HUJ06_029426 [Nelumbo nucifera]
MKTPSSILKLQRKRAFMEVSNRDKEYIHIFLEIFSTSKSQIKATLVCEACISADKFRIIYIEISISNKDFDPKSQTRALKLALKQPFQQNYDQPL